MLHHRCNAYCVSDLFMCLPTVQIPFSIIYVSIGLSTSMCLSICPSIYHPEERRLIRAVSSSIQSDRPGKGTWYQCTVILMYSLVAGALAVRVGPTNPICANTLWHKQPQYSNKYLPNSNDMTATVPLARETRATCPNELQDAQDKALSSLPKTQSAKRGSIEQRALTQTHCSNMFFFFPRHDYDILWSLMIIIAFHLLTGHKKWPKIKFIPPPFLPGLRWSKWGLGGGREIHHQNDGVSILLKKRNPWMSTIVE